MLSVYTVTGHRDNAIKDSKISRSTFYLNKSKAELHIIKPDLFQQEVDSAVEGNLQLAEFSQRCKEVLSSYKDKMKAFKKAKNKF